MKEVHEYVAKLAKAEKARDSNSAETDSSRLSKGLDEGKSRKQKDSGLSEERLGKIRNISAHYNTDIILFYFSM